MKKSKVLLSTILVSALSLTLFAGCGDTNSSDTTTTQAPETTTQAANADTTQAPVASDDPLMDPSGVLSPDKPVTITLSTTSSQLAPASDNKLSQLLKDKLGVTLQYDIVTSDGVDQKVGVMLAGGDYPDLIGTSDNQQRLLKGGAFLKLDEMLASGKYPNLATHVDPYINRLAYKGGEVEEGLYIFPNYNRYYGEITSGLYQGPGFFIQKRVLEDAGYPDLSNMTLEKYFKLIEDYLAKYPETDGLQNIGFTVLNSRGHVWGLTNPPALLVGSPNNGGVVVDENNIATIYADKEYAKDYFKVLNEEYAKGIIDPEAFIQDDDQYLAKIAQGNVLGMHDQGWKFGSARESLYGADMDDRTYVALMPVYDGYEPYYADRDVMNLQQGYGISVTCKQPEVVMTFLEVLMSEAWQKVLSWGIEGEDYEVGTDGMFYRTEQQRTNSKDITWQASNKLRAFNDQMCKRQGQFSDGNAYGPDDQPAEFYATLTKYDQDFLAAYGKQTWREFVNSPPDNPVYYPCWNIPLTDEANEVNTQMEDTALQHIPNAITDSPDNFEANWEAYLNDMAKINSKLVEDEYNAGIQTRIAEWQ